MNQVVAIYADPLLPPTMAFVPAQASTLRRFDPLYVGARRARGKSLLLPPERTLVINESGSLLGKLREIPYKVFGWDPIFFNEIAKFNPVLLHAHFGPAALTALPIARRLEIPLVATFHGYDATINRIPGRTHYGHKRYLRDWRRLAREGNLFIAISKFIEKRLLDQGYPAEKIVQHYIGIDTEIFQPNRTERRQNVVLFAATMTEVKGCEYLLRAIQAVQNDFPEVELVLIGDGPLRDSLEAQARQMVRHYRFLGYQPQDKLRQWMDRARVFCVPSVSLSSGREEGLGLVFVEAQAMEVPVVSFRSGGIPEAVADGETGLLATERDWQQLARHLTLLLSDQQLWLKMSKSARERVLRCFDLRKQTEKLEDIYDQVLGRAPMAWKRELHSEVTA